MKIVVGVDLGSTTTKAVLLDEQGRIVGRGITNSRSNYEVACAIARDDALTSARFDLLDRALRDAAADADPADLSQRLHAAFRLELYLDDLGALARRMGEVLDAGGPRATAQVRQGIEQALSEMRERAHATFLGGGGRKSDFFRDLASAAFVAAAEPVAATLGLRFDDLVWAFDRAILDVETELRELAFASLLARAAQRIAGDLETPSLRERLMRVVDEIASLPIVEASFVGTGYGRQTLPFPKAAVRSEILCHGRGAHRLFPGTRTVLDIGGQDTKAIQVDERGVVTSFQMNDRCAAGCGRYLGYIADELNLGLHELGPLALQSKRAVRINSTCTVFAGAELRERLSLGEDREDILAGLHRAIMLRAMSLLARSGGVRDELTFTGGVCKNGAATKVLRELVDENYGAGITLNAHPDSIYMGALGAALFALDDLDAGRPNLLEVAAPRRAPPAAPANRACAGCS